MANAVLTRQSTSDPKKSHKIAVRIVDAGGKIIRGAEISLFLDDEFSGALVLGDGPGSFDIQGDVNRIRLRAEVGELNQEAMMDPRDNAYQFQFQSAPTNFVAAQPGARCPSGEVNKPCIVCDVGGTRVRICI